MIALDASAFLAYLFKEQGHEQVSDYLDDCVLSTVNLSEVIGRFVRDGHNAQLVLRQIEATQIEIVPFSGEQAAMAAMLLPQTKPLGLSIADRACLALAMDRGITAVTADRVWKQLNIGISIKLIR